MSLPVTKAWWTRIARAPIPPAEKEKGLAGQDSNLE
jgi:hypothetical protein